MTLEHLLHRPAELRWSQLAARNVRARRLPLPAKALVGLEQDAQILVHAVNNLQGAEYGTSFSQQAVSDNFQAFATLASAVTTTAAQVSQRQDAGWLAPIANALEYVLENTKSQLDLLRVPYSYGWSIILLTLFTKILTLPFTKIQVESAINVQKLKPTIDAIKRQYGDNKDKIQRETSALYEKSGVNPLAGCGPTIATIPIFWGLYRTLSNVASDGLLTDGFYWIPSLSGPITVAQQRAGSGISWLWPLVDGHPPIGWDVASRYLVLPVLLVAFQFVSTAIISPPVKPDDDKEDGNITQTVLTVGLPFMVGWFALCLPAGLSLYYFSNITLSSGQQIWLRKLGGAKAFEWKQEIGINQARRTGEQVVLAASSVGLGVLAEQETTNLKQDFEVSQDVTAGSKNVQKQQAVVDEKELETRKVLLRRCKRKKLEDPSG